jgi:hypothetical protein
MVEQLGIKTKLIINPIKVHLPQKETKPLLEVVVKIKLFYNLIYFLKISPFLT